MSNPRIGFIGVGLMGHGMAKNLLAKGFPLSFTVHRDRSRLADLLAAGAKEVKTPAELAAASDVVILCVTGSPQVEANVFGEKGLLSAARAGLTVVDTSTAEPGSTARIREAFAAKGVAFIDAPLARTPKEAEEGRLNTMVGASEADFARLKPVFAGYCENIFHVGPPGAGHTLKLVNNFFAMTIVASIAEGFAVAAKAGVRLDKLFEVVSMGADQLAHLPDDGRRRGGGRPHEDEVRDPERREGHALLHAPRRGAARRQLPRQHRAPIVRARHGHGAGREDGPVDDRSPGATQPAENRAPLGGEKNE
jgi:3-hydroxyisobutyrate dehydrogenase-like beta-hydroxyacid dehydrogenase